MKRIAFYTREEAEEFIREHGGAVLRTTSGDCCKFDTPKELESWSGEIPVLECDIDGEEWLVGYWD